MKRLLLFALAEALLSALSLSFYPFEFPTFEPASMDEAWSQLLWLGALSIPSLIVLVGAALLWVRALGTVITWAKLNLRPTGAPTAPRSI